MDSLLKHRIEADNYLVDKLEKGYIALGKNAADTLENLYLGFQRISWYTSCTMQDYKSICLRLASEDFRALQDIKYHTIDHRTAYKKILELFFEHIINKLPPSDVERLKGRLRTSTLKGIMGFTANFAGKNTTIRALIYGLASLFYINKNFLINIAPHLKTVRLMGLLEHYGLLHKRMQAAYRLEKLDPGFYQILRYYHVDGLYFLVEPGISKYLGYGRPRNAEDVFKMIEDLLS